MARRAGGDRRWRYPSRVRRRTDILFLVMVAVLPLHTLFFSAWISWKPYLIVLVVLACADVLEGVRSRSWPWSRRISMAAVPLLIAIAIGFPSPVYRDRYFRLLLAILVGMAVLLVSERRLKELETASKALRVVFWTAAAMGVTAVVTSLLAVGVFGEHAISAVNDLPGIFRVSKPAYLTSGFLALTNWHQDPGYGAAWATLWATLAYVASVKGLGSGRRWLDGAVIGGLGFWVVMAFSRTGWLAFPIALTAASVLLIRRGNVSRRDIGARIGAMTLTLILLVAAVFAVDPEGVGGDLDLQFAFRLSQGWDLLADITGLFERSDSTAFADRFDVSEQRADVWPEYLDMFKKHPILGVGLGVGWETETIRQEPHNLVLELLAETGLVGGVAFSILLGTILVLGSGVAGGVALLAAFLPAMTQTVLFEPTWWFAAAVFAAGVGVDTRSKELSEVRRAVE